MCFITFNSVKKLTYWTANRMVAARQAEIVRTCKESTKTNHGVRVRHKRWRHARIISSCDQINWRASNILMVGKDKIEAI